MMTANAQPAPDADPDLSGALLAELLAQDLRLALPARHEAEIQLAADLAGLIRARFLDLNRIARLGLAAEDAGFVAETMKAKGLLALVLARLGVTEGPIAEILERAEALGGAILRSLPAWGTIQ